MCTFHSRGLTAEAGSALTLRKDAAGVSDRAIILGLPSILSVESMGVAAGPPGERENHSRVTRVIGRQTSHHLGNKTSPIVHMLVTDLVVWFANLH